MPGILTPTGALVQKAEMRMREHFTKEFTAEKYPQATEGVLLTRRKLFIEDFENALASLISRGLRVTRSLIARMCDDLVEKKNRYLGIIALNRKRLEDHVDGLVARNPSRHNRALAKSVKELHLAYAFSFEVDLPSDLSKSGFEFMEDCFERMYKMYAEIFVGNYIRDE